VWQLHTERAHHIVLISDLHVGALLAPIPFEYDDEGVGFAFREWVRGCFAEFFESFVPRVTNNEPFVLVVNGDLIHGEWHRFGPLAIKSAVKQTRAARDLLNPHAAKASAIYIIEGTEVHSHDNEADIAEELLKIGNVRPSSESPSHKSLSLMLGGKHHRFRHHTSTAGRAWTEASGQANHLADDILRCVRAGIQRPDVLCLAHRHVPGLTLDSNGMSIVTPAWSGVDRHARKVTREDFGVIGGSVLSYAGREKGEFPDVRFYTRSVVESVGESARSRGGVAASTARAGRTDGGDAGGAAWAESRGSRATAQKAGARRKGAK
jgi:hypothetical protein